MSIKWESVIFHGTGFSATDAATALADLASDLERTPKLMVHFMFSASGCKLGDLTSCELTSFRQKGVELKPGAASSIDRTVFGNSGLRFRTAEVLAAQRISELLERPAIYVHYNEAHSSYGYVLFSRRQITYQLVNWEGINGIVASGARKKGAFERIVKDAFPALDLESVEDLFDCFYAEESAIDTFLVAEKGVPLRLAKRLY